MSLKQRLAQLTPAQRQALQHKLANEQLTNTGRRHDEDTRQFHLSNAQQRIWLFEQFNNSAAAYNIVSAIRLIGALDIAALTWAFQQIIDKHQILRSCFVDTDGQAQQLVLDSVPVQISEVSFADVHFSDSERLQALLQATAAVEFDLAAPPLFRLTVAHLADGSAVLVLVLHHILADGWSLQLLEQEVSHYYGLALQGQTAGPADRAVQYCEYVGWQRDWLTSDRCRQQIEYWQQALQQAPGRLRLPSICAHEQSTSLQAKSSVFTFNPALITKLQQYCQSRNLSAFMLLMAGFKVTLAYLAGVDDITIGTPIAARNRRQFEKTIGLFANTLAIRTRPLSTLSFAEYLQQVKRQIVQAYAHQEVPFDLVVDAVSPDRSSNHAPLFQVLFALQTMQASELKLGGLAIEPIHLSRQQIEFDLVTELFFTDASYTAVLSYRSELYEAAFIQTLWQSYIALLDLVIADSDDAIGEYLQQLAVQSACPMQQSSSIDPAVKAVDCRPDTTAIAAYVQAQARASEQLIVLQAHTTAEFYTAILALQQTALPHAVVAAADLPAGLAALTNADVRVVIASPAHTLALNGAASTEISQIGPEWGKNSGVAHFGIHSAVCFIDGDQLVRVTAGQLHEGQRFLSQQHGPVGAADVFLIATELPVAMQVDLLFYCVSNQARYVSVATQQADANVTAITLDDVTVAFVPAAVEIQLPASCRRIIAADSMLQDQRSEHPVCFSRPDLGGIFGWLQPSGLLQLRTDIGRMRVVNAKGLPLPAHARGGLEFSLDTINWTPAGIMAALDGNVCRLADVHPHWYWQRGSGIALTRIRQLLLRAAFVSDCVVISRMTRDSRCKLLCYVQLNQLLTESQLTEHFAALLGQHQIPDFIIVSNIPYDSSGQVDFRQLLKCPLLTGMPSGWQLSPQPAITLSSSGHPLPVVQDSTVKAPQSGAGGVAMVAGPPLPEPLPFACLSAVLQHAATVSAAQEVVFICDADGQTNSLSYQTLYQRALCIAGALQANGIAPQDLILLQLADNLQLTLAFWGVVMAGAVPVMAAPPASYQDEDAGAAKIFAVAQSLPLVAVLASAEVSAALELPGVSGSFGCSLCVFETLDAYPVPAVTPYQAAPDETALMVLTSGSTGLPKAVMQSHRALLARTCGEVAALGFTAHEVSFNWMPLDHVGGLLMHHLTYVYLGAKQVHCPTALILNEPLLWLHWLSVYRATTTWAPNFAYALVNERLKEVTAPSDWDFDLSSLKLLYNGGEAVIATVARKFANSLTGFGMQAGAIKPVWGMSETCSGVIVNTEYDPINAGDADVVEVGQPLPGVMVRVVDTDDQLVLQGSTGRLQLKGDVITQGYCNNAPATEEAFTADGWFCTGDLALIRDGKVSITGREKDLLIINGKNYHCQEVEQVIEKMPQILTAHVAACAIRLPGDATEQLAVFYSEQADTAADAQLGAFIRKAVLKQLGVVVSYLIKLEPEQFPRTSIGKIQRNELANALAAGQFNSRIQHLSEAQQLPGWFYRQVWLPRQLQHSGQTADVVVITGRNVRLNQHLQTLLSRQGAVVHLADFATEFSWSDRQSCRVDSRSTSGWCSLLQSLQAVGKRVHLVYADPLSWPDTSAAVAELLAQADDDCLSPLVRLSQALLAQETAHGQTSLSVLTSCAGPALAADNILPLQGLVSGYLKSLQQELSTCVVRQIDVPADWQLCAGALCQELLTPGHESVVALRPEQRLVESLQAVQATSPAALRQFDPHGFHLVVGGLGGIGSHIVRHLLKEQHAHVLVIGRRALAEVGPSEVFQAFSQFGGRFAYHQAELSDASELAALISRYESDWQLPLRYLINAAGDNHVGSIDSIDGRNLCARLSGKIRLPMLITAALKIARPADCQQIEQYHVGSVNGYFGGVGLSLYAAANSFLNTWCTQQFTNGWPVYCLQFSMWDETGLAAGHRYKQQTMAIGFNVLQPEQGVQSFLLLAAMAGTTGSWLIGLDSSKIGVRSQITGHCQSLRSVLAQQPLAATEDCFGNRIPLSAGDSSTELTDQQRPLNALEQQIAAVWCNLLKIDRSLGWADDFFVLGGNSLLVTRLVNALSKLFHVELPMQIVFEHSQLADLAHYVRQQHRSHSAIVHKPRGAIEPASFAQHRLWFLHNMQGGSAEYNILAGVNLVGAVREGLLAETLSRLVQRHSVLRTTYREVDGRCMQCIDANARVVIQHSDLQLLASEQQPDALQRAMQLQMQTSFDLEQGPVIRAELLQLAANHFVLLFCMHHIASDGWSMSVLSRDFMAIYSGLAAGQEIELAPLSIEYADYADWQHENQKSTAFAQSVTYWQSQLKGLPPLHSLPTDHPRGSKPDNSGKAVISVLDADTTTALHRLANTEKATLYMLLYSALTFTLARWSRAADIVIGTPVSGREHPELEPLLGFFVNTLVLRCQLDDQLNFSSLLAHCKQTILDAFTHQQVPFDSLIDQLCASRSTAHQPMVQIMFALQNFEETQLILPDLAVSSLETPLTTIRFELELFATERDGCLHFSWNYATSLFSERTISQLADSFNRLLRHLVKQPQMMLAAGDTVLAIPQHLLTPVDETAVMHRGYRLDLHQLQQRMLAFEQVADCHLVLRGSGHDTELLAYVVSDLDATAAADLAETAIKAQCSSELPDFMRPDAFCFMQAMPRNAAGLVRADALPAIAATLSNDFVAASTETERKLVAIWSSLLMLESVSVQANFFQAGGNSLLLTRVVLEIHDQFGQMLTIKQLFEYPTIAQLGQLLDAEQSSGTDGLQHDPERKVAPLSFSQQQIWLMCQTPGAAGHYNIPLALKLTGQLDVAALQRTITQLVRRHAILRTTYHAADGVPQQRINPPPELAALLVSIEDVALSVNDAAFSLLLKQEAQQSFALETDLMLRAKLFRLTPQDHVLALTLHHIAADGWSVGILANEFSALYAAFCRGQADPLPALSVQYGDYATWQRQDTEEQRRAAQLMFWQQELHEAPRIHHLPLDFPRPAVQRFVAGKLNVHADASLLRQLTALALQQDATLFMVLQSAFAVLIARWSGETDIMMAVPVAGRERAEMSTAIGSFINTVAFRTDLSGDPSFVALLQRNRAKAIEIFDHAAVPFEYVVEALNPPRSQAYNPLCQIKFVLQNYQQEPVHVDDMVIEPLDTLGDDFNQLHFDLDLSVYENQSGLSMFFSYKKELFQPQSMEIFADSYLKLLRSIANAADTAVSALPLLAEAQQATVLAQSSGRTELQGRDVPVAAVIAEMVAKFPGRIAVRQGSLNLTYAQLWQQANRLAGYLQQQGVQPDDWILIHQQRTPALLVSMLAVWLVGAAYIPVDPANSSERVLQIIADAKTPLVLTDTPLPAAVSIPVFVIEQDYCQSDWMADYQQVLTAPVNALMRAAYAIYTSGSTGKPKGVEISQGALADYCAFASQNYYRESLLGAVLATSHSFDLAVPSLWLPLMHGHQVLMFDARDEIAGFAELVKQAGSYLIRQTPMHLRVLVDLMAGTASTQAEHVFVVGGEQFPPDLAKALQAAFPASQIYNHYGPTEATVGCCMFDVTANLQQLDATIPIGRPMENTQLLVLDEQGKLCPPGMPGELYISTPGLAAGYLQQPALTADKFVNHPLQPGSRMYRSGDRVRYRPDHNLEYLGRLDDQVKVRGFRIEPGEIEARLRLQPEIQDAVVCVQQAGGQQILVAYVTSAPGLHHDIDGVAMLTRLRSCLPEYMVPAQLLVLPALPINDNGKVDKKKLPHIGDVPAVTEQTAMPPQTELELRLAAIWSDLLQIDLARIHLNSDFYALGGQSLLAMRLIAALRNQLDVTISIAELFSTRELQGLCQLVEMHQQLAQLKHSASVELADDDEEITI